jgi:predicted aminopeptidase
MCRVVAALAAFLTLSGCAETRYLLQAGPGQVELFTRARDLDEVLADPRTDPRTRLLLAEVGRIRQFAGGRGLEGKGNYEKYVDLGRSAVVYFIAASRPLEFEPRIWSFPLVGSFPYTGWFSYWLARGERRRLEADGWDVYMRPVRAYSTGGWLRDPVLSTMLVGDEGAFRYLVNVIIHELTHANFFVPDQATFNESLASFVGDQMADEYLVDRFGPESAEVILYREELAEYTRQSAKMVAAFKELEALYASKRSRADKLARKAAILEKLRVEADLSYRPNNASLLGFKTYNSGLEELAAAFAGCGRSWTRFFKAVESIDGDDFPSDQLDELGPWVVKSLRCRPDALAYER